MTRSTPRSTVIVGGGRGGLTLARLLVADGHRVTVVERAADFSAQGHSIGFRGLGLQVMAELGLRESAEATGRAYVADRAYSMCGKLLRTSTNAQQQQAVGGVAVTRRGLLHAVLHEALPPQIDLRFAITPTAIHERGDAVDIELSDGATLRADLLVGADGVNSTVRRLLLPHIAPLDFGGVYVAMTISVQHGLPLNEIATFYGTARIVAFFPVDAACVAVVVYQDDGHGPVPTGNDPAAWAAYFKHGLVGAAEPVRRILAALQTGDDVFHDRIRQIPPDQIVSGRMALLGDAGYCPTFLSGNGAALAAVGAYCLCRCLRKHADVPAALLDYAARIRPLAVDYQANARSLRSLLFTRSPLVVAARELALRFTPAFLFALNARRHYRGAARLADVV